MTTKVIGIKAFRQNLTKLSKKAKKDNVRFIVMNHSVPIGEWKPVEEDELTDDLLLQKYAKEIKEALAQAKRGEVYTAAEVRKHLGLNR